MEYPNVPCADDFPLMPMSFTSRFESSQKKSTPYEIEDFPMGVCLKMGYHPNFMVHHHIKSFSLFRFDQFWGISILRHTQIN